MPNRYIRVPLDAAHAIVESCAGPDLLASYIVTLRFAMKQFRYEQTAAGANAIRKALGVSDFRSKRLRNDLVAMRWGEHGERFLIEPTGKSAGNKPLYRIGRWGGDVAYVPDLLTDGSPGALARLFGASAPPEVRRDALLMLLYAYAHVNYMDYFGVSPDA